MKNIFLTIILLIFWTINSFSQNCNIDIKIDGFGNKSIFLGYYFSTRAMPIDTLHLDTNGKGIFSKDTLYALGDYFLYNKEFGFINFIMPEKQHFSIYSKLPDITGNLSFNNSLSNVLYNKVLKAKNKEERITLIEEIIRENPELYITKNLGGFLNFDFKSNSIKLYQNKFFEHYNLADNQLSRTRYYQKKFDEFFNNCPQNADSLIYSIDYLLEHSKPKHFRFVIEVLMTKYRTLFIYKNKMEYKRTYLHVAKRYVKEASCSDEKFINDIKSEIDNIESGRYEQQYQAKIIIEKRRKEELQRKKEHERIRKEKERVEREHVEKERRVKEQKVLANSDYTKWKLGNKLCRDIGSGIVCGTLEQWNEDKSMIQVKIVTSPGGTYQGNELKKGNTMWAKTSNSGWHLCLDMEVMKSLREDKSNIIAKSEQQWTAKISWAGSWSENDKDDEEIIYHKRFDFSIYKNGSYHEEITIDVYHTDNYTNNNWDNYAISVPKYKNFIYFPSNNNIYGNGISQNCYSLDAALEISVNKYIEMEYK